MTKAKFYIFILIGIFISSCNKKDQVAAYITIEPFEFTPGEDGIYSTKITDGWIYVDNDFLGAFDLPKTIPVLESGENTVVIDAGIKENGIGATPDLYTFYKRYTETVTLVPGEAVTIRPTTTYDVEKANFLFTDTFEGISHRFNFDLDGNSETKIEITDSEVKEGGGAGKIYLDTDNPLIVVGSDYIPDPMSFGLTAYIEMDYKNDVPLLVGLNGYGALNELLFSEVNLGVNPRADWNKIYFNVSKKIQQLALSGAVQYRIVFQAQIPRENGEFTMENAEIYLDNIKLVSL
jgi:hypothetical protein